MTDRKKILEIQSLDLGYFDEIICKDINLTLYENEVLGIAGGSGSGKSTLLKAIINPEEYGVRIIKGKIIYCEQDIARCSICDRKDILGVDIGMILQNPYAAFNPLRKFKKQFRETLISHGMWNEEKSIEKIIETFENLGLENGDAILESHPFEMSGGMNQRISIALAVLLRPNLLLADEPTSALDVTTQVQVLDLFESIKEKYNLSMIIVSHDIGVLAKVSDHIAIMNSGRIVEIDKKAEIILRPRAKYTKRLFDSMHACYGL